MTSHELNEQMKALVKNERNGTLAVLQHIITVERQNAHLELAYSSLEDWLIKGHRYSERAARRRMKAAMLLKEFPELAEKIESGALNLTNLAKANSMMRVQGYVPPEKKREALKAIEDLSDICAEQKLCELFPANIAPPRQEHISVVDQNTLRLAVNLSNQAVADLNRAREILSHKIPSCEASLVLPEVLADYLKRHDPLLQKPAQASQRASRKYTIQMAEGRCIFRDPVTGKRCEGKIRVERDHIIPRANGGDDSIQNARLLCDKHNRFMAEKILGKKRANRWKAKRDQR